MKKYILLFTTLLAISACALSACYIHTAGNLGDTYTTVYGIKMTFEYDDVTLNATDDVYTLDAGSTYTLEVSYIQGGGSTPAAVNGIGVTFECDGHDVVIDYVDDVDNSYVVDYRKPCYYIYSNGAGTSIVTAYSGTYSCTATINWQ